MKKLLKSQKFAPELDIVVSVQSIRVCFIHILSIVQIVCLFWSVYLTLLCNVAIFLILDLKVNSSMEFDQILSF